jgi:hypothetical protein
MARGKNRDGEVIASVGQQNSLARKNKPPYTCLVELPPIKFIYQRSQESGDRPGYLYLKPGKEFYLSISELCAGYVIYSLDAPLG